MTQRQIILTALGIALLALFLLALAATPANAAPPKGKHYAITLMLLDPATGEIDPAPACLSFGANEMCTEAGDCGPWGFTVKQRHRNEWHGTLEFTNEDGILVEVKARGITERKGPGSSIGGTFMFITQGQELNAAFGGCQMTRAECLAFGTTDDG